MVEFWMLFEDVAARVSLLELTLNKSHLCQSIHRVNSLILQMSEVYVYM
jgi:hypothetical protein